MRPCPLSRSLQPGRRLQRRLATEAAASTARATVVSSPRASSTAYITTATAGTSAVAQVATAFHAAPLRVVRSTRQSTDLTSTLRTPVRWHSASLPSDSAAAAAFVRGVVHDERHEESGEGVLDSAPTSTKVKAASRRSPSRSKGSAARSGRRPVSSPGAEPSLGMLNQLHDRLNPVSPPTNRSAEEEEDVSRVGKRAVRRRREGRSARNSGEAEEEGDEIAFAEASTALFAQDEEQLLEPPTDTGYARRAARDEVSMTEDAEEIDEAAPHAAAAHPRIAAPFDGVTNLSDVEETLMDDPFQVPSIDDDANARDVGVPSMAHPMAATVAAADAQSGQSDESILSAVDLLCDDLFHCKTEVLRSFARTRRVKLRTKADIVVQLVEQAHRAAHGENTDLAVTRSVLGDVFDDSVRTSGIRSAWTNKSLEASHIEIACDRHLSFELMANSRKTLMVRHNVGEGARVLRKLTRMFQEEQEQLSLVAVGGVFRNYRAEADEVVRAIPVAELVSPFASLLVSYVRYASSKTMLTRENVNDHLVQMELFEPTVQEVDDLGLLHRLMEMLDPAVREVELQHNATDIGSRSRHVIHSAATTTASTRVFSEVSHAAWDTNKAPDWVHDLARLFCNWETIVRTDLPRFEDVPRYFFDCILAGVVDHYVLHRVYGDQARPADIPPWIRQSLKFALSEHLNNEENTQSAMADLISYVQAGTGDGKNVIRGDFFVSVLSQMQGAFRDVQEERSALHDERVAAILRSVCETASHCTRSHSLFGLLVRLTADMRFHLRFQRVYKQLAAGDRKTIRTKAGLNMERTLQYFEHEHNIAPLSTKAVGFLVVQLLYLSLRGDGSKRPVLERLRSVTGSTMLDLVGLTELKAVNVRELRIAFPPQLSYNSWLNESDTREKSVYNVLPSVAVKGSTNQAMIVSQAPMMKALDAISRVPWRINKYMLHVQEAIVREGFGFGKIRPGFYPLHYHALSDGTIRYPSDRRRDSSRVGGRGLIGEDDDDADDVVFNVQQRRQFYQQQDADWKELSELRSSRIHYLQALRQARSILQFSHIYFPNSMDFRGRMYPLPGRLNHTGSDPFRGLLEYAEPKPLGTVGLYWLKVHLANKMGMSKLSFDERVHYVDEHMEDVVQSAESPLQGDRWWQEASEPLQCLMACKEVASALKCSQGPEKFLSRLPVAVDGSYNGLQHYSAIGRDAFGASLVNLLPSERPADAYTGILKEMLKSIHADAGRDHQVAQRCLGTGRGQDKDHIKRKTIKRPIMTQVYGVTGYGMSEQIFDELQKQNKSHGLWTHTDMKEMAAYLRDKVLESLGVTFRETQNCRRWISDVVQLIWRVQPPELRNALCWTTPLGLVVRQPYKVKNECSLFTEAGYARVAGDAIAPASRKQLTAIAPNLIHSLDATHLAMTALEMQHQGLSMMAVHDSYWTYACDLPKLSQILREQFVNLYAKYDPLWELKEQWEETYFMDLRRHGIKLPEPPKRGDLDLKSVLNSQYFFS